MSLLNKNKTPPHKRVDPLPSGAPDVTRIKALFKQASDFSHREIQVDKLTVTLLFIDGMVNGQYVTEEIIRPLTQHDYFQGIRDPLALLEAAQKGGVYAHTCQERDKLTDVVTDILAGNVAVLVEGAEYCITIEAKGYAVRSISEPSNESVSKGAKDSFVENLRTNTALVRRKIKNPALCFTNSLIGRQTATSVTVVWIEGLTNPELVKKVQDRLADIDIDALLSASQVEEYLIDNKWTVFPQLVYTERVDKFCAHVVDGRVGLLIDGLPVSYVLPGTFAEFLHAPEDFSTNFVMASFITILRYLGLFVSLYLPALYLAIVTFHQEIIPTALTKAIIEAKQDVPLISFFEIMGMLIAFEMLLEAGMRLPKPIGQTVSIVGGLVVGQAAVEAKFVSPVVVIIVAMTAIAGFTSPNSDMSIAIRIWRLILTLCASQIGLYALCLVTVVLLYHLAGIESFGVAYLSPFGVDEWRDMFTRTFLRPPTFIVKWRERGLRTENKRNQK